MRRSSSMWGGIVFECCAYRGLCLMILIVVWFCGAGAAKVWAADEDACDVGGGSGHVSGWGRAALRMCRNMGERHRRGRGRCRHLCCCRRRGRRCVSVVGVVVLVKK